MSKRVNEKRNTINRTVTGKSALSALMGAVALAVLLLVVYGVNLFPFTTEAYVPLTLLFIGTILGLILAILSIRLGQKSLRALDTAGLGRVLAVVGMALGGMCLVLLVLFVGGLAVGYLVGTRIAPIEPFVQPTPLPAMTFPPAPATKP